MPPLDDAAVEEGLRHLLGWEGRDNEIVKTFVRADFAHAMVFVNEVALVLPLGSSWVNVMLLR